MTITVTEAGTRAAKDDVLRLLAVPDAGRPDYFRQWRSHEFDART